MSEPELVSAVKKQLQILSKMHDLLEKARAMYLQEISREKLVACEKSIGELQKEINTRTTAIKRSIQKISQSGHYSAEVFAGQLLHQLKKQTDAMEKATQSHNRALLRQLEVGRETTGNEEAEQLSDLQVSQMRAAENTELINQREKNLEKLTGSLLELQELWQDVAALVTDQGVVLDRIEFNTGSAADATARGVEQLRHARKLQSSARKKKLCICFWLSVVLGVVVLVAVLTTKR